MHESLEFRSFSLLSLRPVSLFVCRIAIIPPAEHNTSLVKGKDQLMMLDWNAYPAELSARVKEMSRGVSYREVRDILRSRTADAGRCRVGAVTVFRSRVSSKGAAYEALLRVPLK